jgi:ferritin
MGSSTSKEAHEMISKEMEKALNEQVEHELFSANLYLSMSSWAETANLPGFAKWLRVQYEEERGHALKLFDYLLDQGAKAGVPAVPAPDADFPSIAAIFQQIVAHEKGVTARINRMLDLAVAQKDHATQALLHWFITEQVEEEKNATQWAAHLQMIGDKSAAILNLDHRAGKRG